jgi:hypothetical protein
MSGVISDWMDQQIWPQIWKMLLDDAYFKLVGHARELTGKLNGSIAQIILDGYLTTQTVAIRRLCDRRRDVISLRRVLTEVRTNNIAAHDQVDQLSDRLDSCDQVYDLVSDHIAHTADPLRRPNVSAWSLQTTDLVEAQKAICRVAVTVERDLFRRNVAINLIPEPQYNIMEDFTLWVPSEMIDRLWKFWHAHKKGVNAWMSG